MANANTGAARKAKKDEFRTGVRARWRALVERIPAVAFTAAFVLYAGTKHPPPASGSGTGEAVSEARGTDSPPPESSATSAGGASTTSAAGECDGAGRPVPPDVQMNGEGNGVSAGRDVPAASAAARTLTDADYARGIVLARAAAGAAGGFDPPPGAEVCGDWEAFGASGDWIHVAFTNRASGAVSRVRVHAGGGADVFDGSSPSLRLSLRGAAAGLAPAAAWPSLPEDARPSRFWHSATPSNTLLLVWQNLLLGRRADSPASFRWELLSNGDVALACDLSRASAAVATNLAASVSTPGGRAEAAPAPGESSSLRWARLDPARAGEDDPDGDGLSTADEVFLHGTDPYCADTDGDGLSDGEEVRLGTDPLDPLSSDGVLPDGAAARLGGADPLSRPPGSTNTVWEHLFYTGTTNAPFALPTPTEAAAVLRVSASGTGGGVLSVGGTSVPLLGTGDARARAPAAPALLVPVVRGEDVPLVLRCGAGLSVSLDSDDFAFGVLPSPEAGRLVGRVNFPNAAATPACVHDLRERTADVSLPVRRGASALSCTWRGGDGVSVENRPPRAARVRARFPARERRTLAYTLAHPDYLFGGAEREQEVRFCPVPSDGDPPGPEPWDDSGVDGDGPEGGGGCFWCAAAHDGGGSPSCGCPCHPPDGGGGADGDGDEPDGVCAGHGVPPARCAPLHEDDRREAERTHERLSGVLRVRRPALFERRVRLDVPGSETNCCPCPGHRRSRVSLAWLDARLRALGPGGLDFRESGESCDVSVAAVRASSSPGDAVAAFALDGKVRRACAFTALGVSVEAPDGPGGAAFEAMAPGFGVPFAAATNAAAGLRLELVTDVGLGVGRVRVEVADATAPFAVWRPDGGGGWRVLADTESGGAVDLPMSAWRRIVGHVPADGSPRLPVRVTSPSPGTARVVLRWWGVVDGRFAEDSASLRVTSVRPPLLPDLDRDGAADLGDAIALAAGRGVHFWANDDTWRGDDAFAAGADGVALRPPVLPPNGGDRVVNGRNDLVNLLPLAVDLSAFRRAWGGMDVVCELRADRPDGVRLVPVGIAWDELGGMASTDRTTLDGAPLHEAELADLAGTGGVWEIPAELLALGGGGAGALAVEFATPGVRRLSVAVRPRGGGDALFESGLDVRVHDVHDMYRWVDLMGACGADAGARYATRGTAAWPDGGEASGTVVFVHGYNMHPSEAWDWSAAVFKRLWWSGLDANFAALLWRGNETQAWIPGANSYATRNYHCNVLNAFRTAGAFKSAADALPGGRRFVVAHSLGNVLVSAARQFHGLEYDRYFMLNAAVPVEAYDPGGGDAGGAPSRMTPKEWSEYPDRVKSARWHGLFGDGDGRSGLTWRGLFEGVDRTVNFHSSADEVLANGDGGAKGLFSRRFAWYNQERLKGSYLTSLSPEAGWAFGPRYWLTYASGFTMTGPVYSRRTYTPAEAAGISEDDLRARPFFRDFSDDAVHGADGGEFARTNALFRWRALAYGIPALSFAAGTNPVPKWGEDNVDMAKGKSSQEDGDSSGPDSDEEKWTHSYFISRPLRDVGWMFKQLMDKVKEDTKKEQE